MSRHVAVLDLNEEACIVVSAGNTKSLVAVLPTIENQSEVSPTTESCQAVASATPRWLRVYKNKVGC